MRLGMCIGETFSSGARPHSDWHKDKEGICACSVVVSAWVAQCDETFNLSKQLKQRSGGTAATRRANPKACMDVKKQCKRRDAKQVVFVEQIALCP